MDCCEKCVMLFKDYFQNITIDTSIIPFPDDLEIGSEKWFYFVMYSCLLNYEMKSSTYHQNILHTYQQYSWFFDPVVVSSTEQEKILLLLKQEMHVRYPHVALKKWIQLSHTLL